MSPQKSAVIVLGPRRWVLFGILFSFFRFSVSACLALALSISLCPFLSLKLSVALCLCFLIDVSRVQCLQQVISAENNDSKPKLIHS